MPPLRLRSPFLKADSMARQTNTGTKSSPPSTSRPAPLVPPRTSSRESPTLGQASRPTRPSDSCLSRGQSFRVAPPPPVAAESHSACLEQSTTSTDSAQFSRKFSFRAAPPPPVKESIHGSSNTDLGSNIMPYSQSVPG